jgi:lysozyme
MATNVQKAVTWIAICTPLVASWEGLALTAYKDKLAHDLLTVCYGMTPSDRPVHVGDTYTKTECTQFLAEDLPKYYASIAKCIHVNITDHQKAAAVSLAYNVGSRAVCKSTFVRQLNAGDPNACDYILRYSMASGRVIQGLLNRRRAERHVCNTGDG